MEDGARLKMKNLISLVCLVLTIGCSSVPDKESRCSSYAAAYNAYKIIAAQRGPSKDEILAAQAAAAFLSMYCNWAPAVAAGRDLGVDEYGVPIITPKL